METTRQVGSANESVDYDLESQAQALVKSLGLLPHPEGGYYREVHRARLEVEGTVAGTRRAAATAIYFLLPAGNFSALHRVASDEVWHHYDGDPLDLHTLDEQGHHRVSRLGRDFASGERPLHVVPAGVWQAAVPVGDRYSLCGCTVAPGFDFADFEMPTRAALTALFPSRRGLILSLTRAP